MKQFFIFLFIVLCYSINSFGQCSAEFIGVNTDKLNGFKIMKSYRLDGKGGKRKKVEYTIVASKNTKYRLLFYSKDGGSDVVLTIQDATRNTCTTNLINGKTKKWLDFEAPTNMYYLTFTFINSNSYCGYAIMGYKQIAD
jgi:hypothetical protein